MTVSVSCSISPKSSVSVYERPGRAVKPRSSMKFAVAGTVSAGGSLVAETRTSMVAVAVLLPSMPVSSAPLPMPVPAGVRSSTVTVSV